jgi:DNA-binding CsgD family transcriptional regulator
LELLGRQRERDALDRLLDAARAGQGSTLVVHGNPGVGKTALLDYAVAAAQGLDVIRTVGVEGEIELPYAALQQLCAPIQRFRERLAEPQGDALGVAFGIRAGPAPSAVLVGLAVTGLVSEAGAEQPLLAVVDDAQWLDRASAQAIAFAARRLAPARVALLIVTREVDRSLAGLPELRVGNLGHRDARALLESVLPAPLDDQVLDRIVVEMDGNPLALVELPRLVTPTQLAGGFGLPGAIPVHAEIEARYADRIANLPRDARLLMLVGAADPTGDVALLWRTARRLGIPEAAAGPAESSSLISLRDGFAFRHPLVRSAVYRSASTEERNGVHRALAEETDATSDPDRRAWHRAQATLVPDDDVADDLVESASRAQARGGFAAAAAFLWRAANLTLDRGPRASRTLEAAEAKQQGGDLDGALTILDAAEAGPLDDLQRVRGEVLRARIAFAAARGREAPALFLDAARRLEVLDVPRARETYLDALIAAVFAGRLAGTPDARHVATAALAAPSPPGPARAVDQLLDALARLIVDGPAATSAVRDALDAFSSTEGPPAGDEGRLWLAGRTAGYIWDYERWDSLTSRQVRVAREAGAIGDLALALSTRVGVHLFAGELTVAESLVEEAAALGDASDERIVPTYGALSSAAFRGREKAFRRATDGAIKGFEDRGEGLGLTLTYWVTAALFNGLGRYDDAFEAAALATVDLHELWFSTFGLVELIEAASRSARTERGLEALAALSESTQASGTPWALGVEARSRALLTDGDAAEGLYQEAIRQLESTRVRLDLARAHLVYGEWLRRQGRRVDARDHLREAYGSFTSFGMEAFAERARIELVATGEQARKRTVETVDQLTPQEAEVSRLAARGDTNREIAGQLFITPSTVEYHLRNVFRKLDVKTRTQLAGRIREGSIHAQRVPSRSARL